MGYGSDDLFEDVFGIDAMILDGKTLLRVLWTGGGKEAALGRHAVTALLNGSNGEVDCRYTAEVRGVRTNKRRTVSLHVAMDRDF